jgi:cobalt-precorrin 5A hydrolase/precorrin-3B C17-methyltransferase
MAGMTARPPAIVILGEGSLLVARRVQQAMAGSTIHGLSGRVSGADATFSEFGDTVRRLFSDDVPLVIFCAAGIVIRTLAPLLHDKRGEPPVIAVAEDGSAVVPLLGGLRGVNALARSIGEALDVRPAITTTGEVRFGATLEQAPSGYELRNPADSKRFMSDLLAGEKVRLSGEASWLSESRLPFADDGRLSIRVTEQETIPGERELVFHPRSVLVVVTAGPADLAQQAEEALSESGVARQAVAAVVAREEDAARPEIHAVAAVLSRPLRLVSGKEAMLFEGVPVSLAVSPQPVDIAAIGRARGRLSVVGLGPGEAGWLAPDARRELADADDIVGYETYVRMAGPFRADQAVHASDNREELDRARHALSLAAQGRSVAVVSSGDPGIFAMAAAVMEALEGSDNPAWHGVDLAVIPGISAAQGAAARAGAPLGHDFCVLSLSDNLKPWEIIEQRLRHAVSADLAIALYNPISRARPSQLGRALEILRAGRKPETPVVLGRDIGRPDENLRILRLDELKPEQVDMRTVVIVGSSTTRRFPRGEGGEWVYTPRWYGDAAPKGRD